MWLRTFGYRALSIIERLGLGFETLSFELSFELEAGQSWVTSLAAAPVIVLEDAVKKFGSR